MKKKKIMKIRGNNLEEIDKSIINKGIYCFVLYEEEICIISIKIPDAKRKIMDKIVENQVLHRFVHLDQISYSYSIDNLGNKISQVYMYCINSYKLDILKRMNKSSKIKGIYLIQFCYMDYIIKNFKIATFFIGAKSEDNIYFIGCRNRRLSFSSVIKINKEENLNEILISSFQKFLLKNGMSNPPIYLFNCNECFKLDSATMKTISIDFIQEDFLIKKYVGEI